MLYGLAMHSTSTEEDDKYLDEILFGFFEKNFVKVLIPAYRSSPVLV